MNDNIVLPKEYFLSCMKLVSAVNHLLDYTAVNDVSFSLVRHYISPDVIKAINYLEETHENKLRASVRRQAYTSYIKEKEPAKREELRQAYISMSNIHKDWISDKEL